MKQRSIYLTDEIWRLVKIDAASRGITSSQVVANALEAHLQPKPADNVIRTPADAERIFQKVGQTAQRTFTPVPKPTSKKPAHRRGAP